MQRYLFSLIFTVLAFASALAADFISSAPGSLEGAFTDPSGVLVLKVKGPMDASDLFFISEKMTDLSSLDLSEATIEAYEGKKLHGATTYDANLIPAAAFAGTGLTAVVLPSTEGLVVGPAAFAASALESFSASTKNLVLGAGALSSCPELASVSLPASATLENHAFASCPKLAEVSLGGITAVPDNCFSNCGELATVGGTENLSTIGASAFQGCSSLALFSFPAALKSLGADAFRDCGLTEVRLGGSTALKSLPAWAFANNESLWAVTLPENLASIGEGCFFDCPSLSDIPLPKALTEIPAYAFLGASSLGGSDLNNGRIERIGAFALKDATGVSDLQLPATVSSIGSGAMEGMTGLRKIDASGLTEVPELGEGVWEGVNQSEVELHVLQSVSEEFKAAPQWQDFKFMVTTGSDSAILPDGASGVAVEGRFVGNELQLRSRGSDIVLVQVYRPSGALVATASPSATDASIDTSATSGSIFIVECTLADGSRAALKLMR